MTGVVGLKACKEGVHKYWVCIRFLKQTQNCNGAKNVLFYRQVFALIRILCSTNQIMHGHTSSVKPFATEAEGFFSWNTIIIGPSLAINALTKHNVYPLFVWAYNHGLPILTITNTKHWTRNQRWSWKCETNQQTFTFITYTWNTRMWDYNLLCFKIKQYICRTLKNVVCFCRLHSACFSIFSVRSLCLRLWAWQLSILKILEKRYAIKWWVTLWVRKPKTHYVNYI